MTCDIYIILSIYWTVCCDYNLYIRFISKGLVYSANHSASNTMVVYLLAEAIKPSVKNSLADSENVHPLEPVGQKVCAQTHVDFLVLKVELSISVRDGLELHLFNSYLKERCLIAWSFKM